MPDLLLELFSEEIPARMQRQAADDLKRLVTNALVDASVTYDGAQAFATPRRIVLHVVGLLDAQPRRREERKGPRVGAPEGAIQGFLKSAGLASLAQAKIVSDGKKGEFYVAVIDKPGRATRELIAELVPAILRAFPWPKSMRWGAASARGDALRWVRPLRSILCTFGGPHEAPEPVPFALGELTANDVTHGHRFLAPAAISVRRYEDYVDALFKAKVVLDADRRKQMILADAKSLAFANGLELIEDEGLLEEVAGLVEWPVVLMGEFEAEFLEIPPEVIRATIRANQKCFVLRDASGKLANKFILVSNLVASDGGAAIAAGNERVVRARLSDARHFWRTDLADLFIDEVADRVGREAPPEGAAPASPVPDHPPFVDAVVDRVGREAPPEDAALASPVPDHPPFVDAVVDRVGREAPPEGAALASPVPDQPPFVDAVVDRVGREAPPEGAALASPDAVNDRVYKKRLPPLDQRLEKLKALGIVFHEKLGTQGERVERIAKLAAYLAQHFGWSVKNARRAACLAKADLVTEMVGEFPELQGLMGKYYALAQGEDVSVAAAIEEHYKPQGPNDRVPTSPESIAVALADKIDTLVGFWAIDEKPTGSKDPYALRRAALGVIRIVLENELRLEMIPTLDQNAGRNVRANSIDLLAFFADRLKVYLRDKGARHDLIDAVFALPGQDDLLMIVRRVEALGRFLDTADGKSLLAGYRRAANILKAEEKKDGEGAFAGPHDLAALVLPEEKALADALGRAGEQARDYVAKEDFEGAMRALSALRAPVDAFFLAVTVNAAEAALRLNRLRLLGALREAAHTVADFAKIAG